MNILPFNFEENNVRVITGENGEPWFVASDIAGVLGYSEAHAMTRHLDDDETCPVKLTDQVQDRMVTTVNESGLYSAILRSRKPEAKRFKKWVTAEVLPAIRRTGRYEMPRGPVYAASPAIEAVQLADVIATALRVSNSGRLGMIRQAVEVYDPVNLFLLPAYAVDAPSDAAAVSSETTHSATHLLVEHGRPISVREFNNLAEDAGLLEERSRQSSTGRTKYFKCVTEEGLRYGKNLSNPQSPRETQPHWYDSRFKELLEYLEVSKS